MPLRIMVLLMRKAVNDNFVYSDYDLSPFFIKHGRCGKRLSSLLQLRVLRKTSAIRVRFPPVPNIKVGIPSAPLYRDSGPYSFIVYSVPRVLEIPTLRSPEECRSTLWTGLCVPGAEDDVCRLYFYNTI